MRLFTQQKRTYRPSLPISRHVIVSPALITRWNAARFTLMNLDGFEPDSLKFEELVLSDGERWILHRLNETARETGKALEEYRFNEAAEATYDFVWREVCDWYLEAIKPTVKSDPAQQQVLRTVLDALT